MAEDETTEVPGEEDVPEEEFMDPAAADEDETVDDKEQDKQEE